MNCRYDLKDGQAILAHWVIPHQPGEIYSDIVKRLKRSLRAWPLCKRTGVPIQILERSMLDERQFLWACPVCSSPSDLRDLIKLQSRLHEVNP